MYAIKKHINKVLAVFLCACLLLSYNPAFGAVDNAWAAPGDPTISGGGDAAPGVSDGVFAPSSSDLDKGVTGTNRGLDMMPGAGTNNGSGTTFDADGNVVGGSMADSASTVVTATTFNSKLEVAYSDPVYGKATDIAALATKEGKSFPIKVEAVYADGPSPSDYTFKWNVTHIDDQGKDVQVIDLYTISASLQPTVTWDSTRNVAISSVDLAALFAQYPNLFRDGTIYTFTCDVSTADGSQTVTPPPTIPVYTVDESVLANNYLRERLDSVDNTKQHVVSLGKFLGSSDLYVTVDDTDINRDLLYQKFQAATTDPKVIPSTGIGDETYSISEKAANAVYQPQIKALDVPMFDGTPLKPYFGNTYQLLFPLDADYLYDAVENTSGLQNGNEVLVLWRNTTSSSWETTKVVPATVVYDGPSGQWMARITYDASTNTCWRTDLSDNKVAGTERTGAGVGYENYFTVLYSSANLKPDKDVPEYYYVITDVAADSDGNIGGELLGGLVQRDGTKVIKERVDTPTSFDIIPASTLGTPSQRYKLKSLKFTNSKDSSYDGPDGTGTELLKTPGSTSTTVNGITMDASWSRVTIDKPLISDYRAQYKFVATFELATGPSADIIAKKTKKHMTLSVVDKDTKKETDKGLITINYTNEDDEATELDTSDRNPRDVYPLETSMVHLAFSAHADETTSEGVKSYAIYGVQTRVERTGGPNGDGWRDASWANYQLLIPSLEVDNLEVRLLVGPAAPASDPVPATYYLLNVNKIGGDASCSVSPTRQVLATKSGAVSATTITVRNSDTYWATDMTVTVHGVTQKVPFKWGDPTFSYIYNPVTLDGDVTIDVTFELRDDLKYKVKTEVISMGGSNGGTVTPDWRTTDGEVTVNTFQEFMFIPAPGFYLKEVRVHDYDEMDVGVPMTDMVQGGTLKLQITKDTLVKATFGKISGWTPDLAKSQSYNVQAWIAQKDMLPEYESSSIPAELKEIFSKVNNADANGLIYGSAQASVPYGDRFGVSFYPATEKYEVSQVVVVKYNLITKPDDTEAKFITGKPEVYTTNNTSWLEAPITANTDIIVFFSPCDEEEEPTWSMGDYIRVKADSVEGGAVDPNFALIKQGSPVSVKFTPEDATWAFDGAQVVLDNPTAAEVATIPADTTYYLLTGMTSNVIIKPKWRKVGETPTSPTQVRVKSDAYYSEGWIGITSSNIALNPAGIAQTKPATFPLNIFVYDTSKTSVESVSFSFTGATAFIGTEVVGGATLPTLAFASTAPTGFTAYTGSTITATTIPGVSDLTQWYVKGLPVDLTASVGFKTDGGGGVTASDNCNVTAQISGLGTGTVLIGGTPNTKTVPKGYANLPVKITPAANSFIESVTVDKKPKDPLGAIWNWVNTALGLTTSTADITSDPSSFAQTGSFTFSKVDFDYDISVKFGKDTNYTGDLDNKVAIHALVMDGSNKGGSTVTPATVLLDRTTGTQEYIVDPGKDSNGKFYRIDKIVLTDYSAFSVEFPSSMIGDTKAASVTNPYIEWFSNNDPYRNVFKLNTANLLATSNNYTIEVHLTKDGDAGNKEPDPTKPNTSPETPEVKDAGKWFTVTPVVALGTPVSGTSSGGGGTVYPTAMVLSDSTKSQTVEVVPAPGYVVDSANITVTGATGTFTLPTTLPEAGGRFTVSWSDIAGTGVSSPMRLTVPFKPAPAATYSVYVSTDSAEREDGTKTAASGTVTPNTTSILNTSGLNSTQTLTLDPSNAAYTVAGILDEYIDAAGNRQPTPGGLSWTRAKNEATKATVTVTPINVGPTVVNRYITVLFGLASDYDWNDVSSSNKTTIRVNTFYSTGVPAEYQTSLSVFPQGTDFRVSKSTGSRYTFSFYVNPLQRPGTGTPGCKIYRVMVNGKNILNTTQVADMWSAGAYTFTTSELTRSVNTLSIYVTYVDKDDNVIAGDKSGVIDLGWGSGGTVSGGTNSNGRISALASKTTSGAAPTSDLFENDRLSNGVSHATAEVSVKGVAEVAIEPDKGKQIDMVYMYGCYLTDFAWYDATNPNKTTGTSLYYVVQVIPGFTAQPAIFVTFKGLGDGEKFIPTDWWNVDDADKMLNSDLTVYLQGAEDDLEDMRDLKVIKTRTPYPDVDELANVLWVETPKVGVGAIRSKDNGTSTSGLAEYEFGYYMVDGDTLEVTVGPLLDWNTSDPDASLLFTIDPTQLMVDGNEPTAIYGIDKDGKRHKISTEEPAEGETPTYYGSYVIQAPVAGGTAAYSDDGTAALADEAGGKYAELTLPMVKLTKDAGNFNPSLDDAKNNQTGDKYVTVFATTNGIGGHIEPTSASGSPSGAWTNDTKASSWQVADGTYVAFKLVPDDNYRISSLTRNGGVVDPDGNGVYRFQANYVENASNEERLVATFAPKGSEESFFTLTVEIEPSADGAAHGTTSPEPGKYRYEKGSPVSITLMPDNGYVVKYVWVDGTRYDVNPNQVSWPLVASYHDRTFKVQYSRPLVVTGSGGGVGDYIQAGLAATGDHPVVTACIIGAAVLAGVGVWQMRRRKEAAARVAKYSVTKRK